MEQFDKEKSLAKLNPELAKEWNHNKNGSLTPFDITCGSEKKVWWICKNNHEWQSSVASRSTGRGCPYCSGKMVRIDNCLATTDPELAKQWNVEKNDSLTPYDVTPNSNKKVWWRCDKGHEWESTCANRSRGYGCPYCQGKRVNTDSCLATVNPDLAKEWHTEKNGTLTPLDVHIGSALKVWWKCPKGHEWMASVRNNKGCPICSSSNV